MLSVLVLAGDGAVHHPPSPEAVVRTLSSLVAAAIEGLVRDVVLAAQQGHEDLRRIADHAGCELAEASDATGIIAAGLGRTRGDALLVLRAGRAPESGFFEEVSDLADRLPSTGAIALRASPETFITRLVPSLAHVVGLIAPRSLLRSDAPDLAALVRAARPRSTLRTRLRRVG